MNAGFAAPAVHICIFALGCALIHGARTRAAAVTPMLGAAALFLAALVLIAATLVLAPDEGALLDDIAIYAAA